MTKKSLEHPALGTEISADGKIRTSWLVTLCRAKANQVMMMKRRGYEIEPSENDWIEASLDDAKLVQMVKLMMNEITGKSTQVNFGPKFNKKYKIQSNTLNKQFTGEVYPYLREGDEIPEQIAQFRLAGNTLSMVMNQAEIITPKEYITEVFFGNIPKMETREVKPFQQISSYIFIETGDESVYKDEQAGVFRMRLNTEIFHINHFTYDVFQHWLVPDQKILTDTEKLLLLCPYYVNQNGEARKNCLFLESQLPTIPISDPAMRRLGAVPGNIIRWENHSYLTTLNNVESGYMLVTGAVTDVSSIVDGPGVENYEEIGDNEENEYDSGGEYGDDANEDES